MRLPSTSPVLSYPVAFRHFVQSAPPQGRNNLGNADEEVAGPGCEPRDGLLPEHGPGPGTLRGLGPALGAVKDESSRRPRGQARGQEGLAGVGGGQN